MFYVIIPIFVLLLGAILIISGIRMWIRKTAKFADPFLWGSLTGGLGTVVVRSLFGDAEIKGFAARVLALFQVAIGLLFIYATVSSPSDARRYAEVQARNASKAAAVEAARREGLPLKSSLPLLPPPSKITTPVAVAEPSPAPATPPAAPAPQPAPKTPGTVEPGSKDWLPEGMQRR